MANISAAHVRLAVDRLLERKDDQHQIDVFFDFSDPARVPGPDLRRDEVDDPVAGPLGNPGQAQIEPWIVDQHNSIEPFLFEPVRQDFEHPQRLPQLGETRNSYDIEPVDAFEQPYSGLFHLFAAKSEQFDVRHAFPQGGGELGAMLIAGCLAGHNQYAGQAVSSFPPRRGQLPLPSCDRHGTVSWRKTYRKRRPGGRRNTPGGRTSLPRCSGSA